MIQHQTQLKVIDNSGAKTVKCIKILGGFKRRFAYLEDTVIVSVKELRNRFKIKSKVKKGEIYKAIILRTKKKQKQKDGSFFCFSENSVCLINSQEKFLFTRILGPVTKTFKTPPRIKLLNTSSSVVR